MKKITFLLLICVFASFSLLAQKEYHYNAQTNTTTYSNGLSFTDGYIINEKGNQVNPKTIFVNEMIDIVVKDASGFTLDRNDNVNLGVSYKIMEDVTGLEVANNNDLFLDRGVMSLRQVANVKASLRLNAPLVAGKRYKIDTRIWDKNGEGEIKTSSVIILIN